MHSHATRYHRQANTLQGATKNERPFYSVCRAIQVTTNRERERERERETVVSFVRPQCRRFKPFPTDRRHPFLFHEIVNNKTHYFYYAVRSLVLLIMIIIIVVCSVPGRLQLKPHNNHSQHTGRHRMSNWRILIYSRVACQTDKAKQTGYEWNQKRQ